MGTCKKCGNVVGIFEMQNGYCKDCIVSTSKNNAEYDLNNMRMDLLDTMYEIFSQFATKEEIESIFHIIFEYQKSEVLHKTIEDILKRNNAPISSPPNHFIDACEKITDIVNRRIPNKYVAREFILQDLEGASLGAKTRPDIKEFLDNSGFTSEEYMNSNKNEDPLIDGINGPQQLLNFFIGPFISETLDRETNAQFRMCIIDNIMMKYKLGKYEKSSEEKIDENTKRINQPKPVSELKKSNDYISSIKKEKVYLLLILVVSIFSVGILMWRMSNSVNTENLDAGVRMYNSGAFKESKELFERACEDEVFEGCYWLGTLYDDGKGVKQDYSKAKNLYDKACEGGSANGCSAIGTLYYTGLHVKQDYFVAKEMFVKACNYGSGKGCSSLGYLYLKGEGVKKDYSRAKEIFTKACNYGSTFGCINLGNLYYDGLGVKKDYSIAKKWYDKACNDMNANGCFLSTMIDSKMKNGQ